VGLFVGRRFGPKGLFDAVRALPSLPALHLVVLGAGREGKFSRAAGSLGVSSRLHFAGFSENPREYYAAAEVLIHPTYYDPCSLSVLEALACGVPVITTTANGAGELITLGREGFVLEPGDVAGIAAAAEQILRDWENFHTSARERARDLSFESHLARVEEVLIRAAMRRPRK
jgi:UDP-glucose:(heptosyl)LPS alpha-1,3-glucosyltransferase